MQAPYQLRYITEYEYDAAVEPPRVSRCTAPVGHGPDTLPHHTARPCRPAGQRARATRSLPRPPYSHAAPALPPRAQPPEMPEDGDLDPHEWLCLLNRGPLPYADVAMRGQARARLCARRRRRRPPGRADAAVGAP